MQVTLYTERFVVGTKYMYINCEYDTLELLVSRLLICHVPLSSIIQPHDQHSQHDREKILKEQTKNNIFVTWYLKSYPLEIISS